MRDKLNKLKSILEVLNTIQGTEKEDMAWFNQVNHLKQHLDAAIEKLDVLVKRDEKIRKELENKRALEAQKEEVVVNGK